MNRYDMRSEYNPIACEDQVVPVEEPNGRWVRYEDVVALAAYVESLRGSVKDVVLKGIPVANVCHNLAYSSRHTESILELIDALKYSANKTTALVSLTPQRHVRELRADALFEFKNAVINELEKTVLVAHSGCRGTDASDLDDVKVIDASEFIQFTNQYADSILKGEVK